MTPIVVIGAGGHAKVVIEAIRAEGRYDPVGVVAPTPPEGGELLGVPWAGADDDLAQLRTLAPSAFVAIGDNALRQRLAGRLIAAGFELPVVRHPDAVISPTATLGEGTIVMARAAVGPLAVLGPCCVVNTGAIVEHDNVIGTASHVAPGATLGGTVRVGDRTLVGIGTSVRPLCRIGNDVVIGVGSAVVGDIPDGITVAGAPARRIGHG